MPRKNTDTSVDWIHPDWSHTESDREGTIETVVKCIREDNPSRAIEAIESWSPDELADLIVQLSIHQASILLGWLPRHKAGQVFASMHPDYRASLARVGPSGLLKEMFGETLSDNVFDTLQPLPSGIRERVADNLAELGPMEVAPAYPDGTAGFIMDRRLLMIPEQSTVSEAIDETRRFFASSGSAGTAYVINSGGSPVGIVRPRDLLVAAARTPIPDIMWKDFPIAHVLADPKEAAVAIEGTGCTGLPVVNDAGQLVGQISRRLRERIIREDHRNDLLHMSQVSSESRATDGYIQIVRGRLPWLLAGLIGATGAAFIIGSFEEELAQAAILAAFIPVVMSMAGNSGLQAAGVSVQVLASGSSWPGDHLALRLLRELFGALSNGGIAGAILATMIVVLSGIFEIDNAVRLAMATSFSLVSVTTIAALVGASVPFLLDRIGVDPATATGVFITTSNDVIGVTVYFTMASLLYF